MFWIVALVVLAACACFIFLALTRPADASELLFPSPPPRNPRSAAVGVKPKSTASPVPSVWVRLAECESGGRWHLDAYHDGGLQHHPDTWTAMKRKQDPPFAWQASKEAQVAVAKRVLAAQGWEAWPACSRRLGLR